MARSFLESVKRWMLKELQGDASVASLVPAFSVAGASNPDDTPTKPGVFVLVPSGTQPERFLAYAPLVVACVHDSEQKSFDVLQAVLAKFVDRGADRPAGWVVDPLGNAYRLRVHRTKVDRVVAPLIVTTSVPDLFLAEAHVSVWGSVF